ncbi:MAG: cupin domain-containing protein [Chloroflexota bacterium]|nr:cupin domain-containing protein [Chloroflexota bacterium]
MTDANDRNAGLVATLVRGDQMGGQLAVVELYEVQGQEAPRHLHVNEDEMISVLEGTLTVCVDEAVLQATAGTCLFRARGTGHDYAVESAAARLLVVVTPSGLEEFFREPDASPRMTA